MTFVTTGFFVVPGTHSNIIQQDQFWNILLDFYLRETTGGDSD